MFAAKATTLRQNFRDTCDRVCDGEILSFEALERGEGKGHDLIED